MNILLVEDDAVIADRSIIKSLRDDLIKGGKYSVKLPDGTLLPWKTIDSEGTIRYRWVAEPNPGVEPDYDEIKNFLKNM